MPQDKRRSISYRSFVTCNDPKGIECGAIRKSKINSHKKEQFNSKIETDRNQENNTLTKSVEIIKERKNDEIAKELLKGALDLQESLVMLGKLQEASSFMLGLSRKEKQKLEDCTFDGMVNGVKGLRNVVRESLVKQNVMIANPVFEEHYYDHRKMGSPDMMMPSTSSSQSSMIYSSSFVHSDSCVSSPAVSVKKKGKESNLIVKLMGLESFPSSPRNYMDKEKILKMSKPLYDNDSPRAKRVQLGAQEGVMKQRSVEELFENIKFKGLLRHTQESDIFASENERTPIVVMKPMRYPCLDLDKPFSPKIWKEMGMKPIHSKTSDQEIVRNEDVYFREKYEVAGGFDCEEKGKYIRKVASAKANASENLHSKPLKKKAENKKASEKVGKLSDQEKFASATIKKQKDGKSTSKNQTWSAQTTSSTSMSDHSRKRRTVNERKNRQRALLLEENQMGKGQNKKTKAFNKEDNDLRGDSKSVSLIVTNNNVKNQPHIQDYDIGSRIKLLDTPECISYDLLNDKKIIQHGYNQTACSEITSVSTSECYSVDQLGETQSPLSEVTLSTTHENGIAVDHNMNRKGTQSLKSGIESPKKTKLNALLLSNSLFVSHLEERFNVQVNPYLVPSVIDNDQDLESSRLLIDCANEMLELKSQQLSESCLPFPPSYITNTGSSLCLDRLLEEVWSGIDDLRGFLRPVTDEFPSDNLYLILDRDLRYKSGLWGVGWRSMYTQDVVEVVVSEIDRFVLNKLIEEILVDLLL